MKHSMTIPLWVIIAVGIGCGYWLYHANTQSTGPTITASVGANLGLDSVTTHFCAGTFTVPDQAVNPNMQYGGEY